jgi:hypothetical protein
MYSLGMAAWAFRHCSYLTKYQSQRTQLSEHYKTKPYDHKADFCHYMLLVTTQFPLPLIPVEGTKLEDRMRVFIFPHLPPYWVAAS